ncbi:MAG: hypothetical protein AAF408_07360 [Pseudomonadota bacterium]
MTRIAPLAFAVILSGPAFAADWELRPGDVPLSPDELSALAGETLVFFDDGQSKYSAGGAYSYTYSAANGGGTAYGTYRVAEDGSICTEFRNGASRCDLYVRDGNRLVLIDEKGQRFPVRSRP